MNFKGIRILDLVDPIGLSYSRAAKKTALLHKWLLSIEGKRMLAYERRIALRFDYVGVVAEADLSEARENVVAGCRWFPQGVNPKLFNLTADEEGRDAVIVMTGNMGYLANVDAVHLFCDEILPKVWRRNPSAKFWAVGDRPTRDIRRLERLDQRIRVTGRVDDIGSYLARAKVSVCPVRLGAGVQNKIVEAMAAGVPVVSTEFGNRGIGATPDRDLLIARNSDDFAEKILSLLNGDRWREISSNGREFARTHFSWSKRTREFEQLLVADNSSKLSAIQ